MAKHDYSLTPKQQEAFDELEKAFKKCCRRGMIVWDWYGNISAVNGKVVKAVVVEHSGARDDDIEMEYVSQFRPNCLGGGMADDESMTVVIYQDGVD